MSGSGRWFRYVGGRTAVDVPRWWLADVQQGVPFEAPEMENGGVTAADDLAGHAEFVECTPDGTLLAGAQDEGE